MPEYKFRTQPILNATTLELCAVEVLCRHRPQVNDEIAMMELDMQALELSSHLSKETGLRTHSNMEYSTLVLAPWKTMSKKIRPGMVIELVERNHLLKKPEVAAWVKEMLFNIRRLGGIIAMDDVELTDIEKDAVRLFHPEIIKVTNRDGFERVRKCVTHDCRFVAEFIETECHADLARNLGAHELQGFWCDRQVRRQQCEAQGDGWPAL
jgi:EAL domain-containing protein (putative c-di-GMP-specific phosphodiesterase class I)